METLINIENIKSLVYMFSEGKQVNLMLMHAIIH